MKSMETGLEPIYQNLMQNKADKLQYVNFTLYLFFFFFEISFWQFLKILFTTMLKLNLPDIYFAATVMQSC